MESFFISIVFFSFLFLLDLLRLFAGKGITNAVKSMAIIIFFIKDPGICLWYVRKDIKNKENKEMSFYSFCFLGVYQKSRPLF